ncbi:hypothetical protein AOQ84DRAFT_355036 [Glonium stellatum]|uniref:Uncharacterized protein n=1 Tax=Glonium stellatum TaxID=574774 RepID=A0A8E2JRU3_9PEZI|nr:hypothetical protein AOQ84DRAFT_355036 [Glonium stellatum]
MHDRFRHQTPPDPVLVSPESGKPSCLLLPSSLLLARFATIPSAICPAACPPCSSPALLLVRLAPRPLLLLPFLLHPLTIPL